MRVGINKDGSQELREVYNPINLVTNSGESLSICMRDSGFEFNYGGNSFEAKLGDINLLGHAAHPWKEVIRKLINGISITDSDGNPNTDNMDFINELRLILKTKELNSI